MKDINDMTKSLESRGILSSPLKMIVPCSLNNSKEVELFHIINDPNEVVNIAVENTEIVQ